MTETFGEYLARQKCVVCGKHAGHRQLGAKPPYQDGTVCSEHIDQNAAVFALND